LNVAKGTVISFLEDDDLFFANKLEIVYKEFKKDINIVYYHNLCVPINENGKAININNMQTSPYANMSSISIKKSIVKIHNADKINALLDILMYLYALESNKKIIRGKEKLTYYMFHNSASNIVSNNFEEVVKSITTSSYLNLNNYIFFNNLLHSKKAINFLNSQITGTQIYIYIFGSNEIPRKLLNFIINNSGSSGGPKNRVALFLSYLLIKVYPKSRKYIINKLWNIHSKRVNEVI